MANEQTKRFYFSKTLLPVIVKEEFSETGSNCKEEEILLQPDLPVACEDGFCRQHGSHSDGFRQAAQLGSSNEGAG